MTSREESDGNAIEASTSVTTATEQKAHKNPTLPSTQVYTDNDNCPAYHLRFSRMTKKVKILPASKGLVRSSIGTTEIKINNDKDTNCGMSVPAADEETPMKSIPRHHDNEKTILNQVSGEAVPGQVLALMGPSGSGKTSLLSALAGRCSYQEGVVSVNGKSITSDIKRKKQLASRIAYIPQFDAFLEHLTVHDQLVYTALLRLPECLSETEKLRQVAHIMDLLYLTTVAETPLLLLSGGERKRVSIGSELLTNPAILLCDEICSGLDSAVAVFLVQMLQSLAKTQNKTIVLSIHQPSSAMLSSFEKIILLAAGNVVYFGTPLDSLSYLEYHLFFCPAIYNCADYWMDLLVGNGVVEATKMPYSTYLIMAWRNDKADKVAKEMDEALLPDRPNDSATSMPVMPKYHISWWTQFGVLVHRSLKNSRSAIFTPLNMIKSVAIGFIAGCLWYQLPYSEFTVFNQSSFFFFTQAYWCFDSMFAGLLTFASEKKVVLNERAKKSYRLSAYFIAKTFSEAPTRLTLPLLYLAVAFPMAGFTAHAFISTTCVTLLSVLAGDSIGLLVGASMDDPDESVAVVTILALGLMLMGGFYVNNVPSFCEWFKYLSPFKYAYHTSLNLVFFADVPCDGSGQLAVCGGYATGYATKHDVLTSLGSEGTIAFNISMLVAIIVVARCAAYLALRAKRPADRA